MDAPAFLFAGFLLHRTTEETQTMFINTAFLQNTRPDERLGLRKIAQLSAYWDGHPDKIAEGVKYLQRFGAEHFYLDEMGPPENAAGDPAYAGYLSIPWGTDEQARAFLKKIGDQIQAVLDTAPKATVAHYQWFGYWHYPSESWFKRHDLYGATLGSRFSKQRDRVFLSPMVYRMGGWQYPLQSWKDQTVATIRRLAPFKLEIKPMHWARYHRGGGSGDPADDSLIPGGEWRIMHAFIRSITKPSGGPAVNEMIHWGAWSEDWNGGEEQVGWWAESIAEHLGPPFRPVPTTRAVPRTLTQKLKALNPHTMDRRMKEAFLANHREKMKFLKKTNGRQFSDEEFAL